jgi:predicted RNase H-like nuclease (RuvC/YqgF family)
MEIQRDELVENYIKSQRLAVALGRDGKERAQHKAVKNLGDHSHGKKKTNLELILSRNLNLISSLKDRIKDFEHDNDNLAGENEELRQFSLDGYQIAKNVQSLSSERETLSVDLADKSKMIQKLLDQNQELSGKLKNAQEHAISLINRSNHNMRRLQPGAQEPQHHPVRYQ